MIGITYNLSTEQYPYIIRLETYLKEIFCFRIRGNVTFTQNFYL